MLRNRSSFLRLLAAGVAATTGAAVAPWGVGPAHAADPLVFTPNVIASLQNGAGAVATGNLNGDARPDVVVSSRQAQKVNVFINGASGYTQTAYDTTLGVENITVGDVDGDGDSDFVTSDAVAFFDGPRSITVYTNNGSGSFTASDVYFYEAVAADVAIADVTGSATPELVVSDYYGAEVQVLTRGSGGTYSLGSSYAVGDYPYGIVVADLNGDQIPDIATANRESNDATILTGQSAGVYTRTDVALGSSTNDIAAADVDGDSAPELVTLSQGQGGDVNVLDRVNGTWGATALETRGPSSDLAVADVDGDSKMEIVTVGFNNIYAWKYQNGTYARVLDTAFGDPQSPIYANSIAPADLDRDGDVDLAASFSGSNASFGSLTNGSSVPNTDPVPNFAVTASGGARVGTTRSATTPLDSESSITLAYQWQRAGRGGTWVDIDAPGSTSKDFLLPPSVQNVNVRVQVTATRGASTRTKASAPLQILSGNHNASNPRIEGDREVGGELTAVYDDAVEPAGLKVTYNWTIGGNEIRLTGRTITVPRKARGKKVIVDIRLSAPGYHNQEFRSPAIRIRD